MQTSVTFLHFLKFSWNANLLFFFSLKRDQQLDLNYKAFMSYSYLSSVHCFHVFVLGGGGGQLRG